MENPGRPARSRTRCPASPTFRPSPRRSTRAISVDHGDPVRPGHRPPERPPTTSAPRSRPVRAQPAAARDRPAGCPAGWKSIASQSSPTAVTSPTWRHHVGDANSSSWFIDNDPDARCSSRQQGVAQVQRRVGGVDPRDQRRHRPRSHGRPGPDRQSDQRRGGAIQRRRARRPRGRRRSRADPARAWRGASGVNDIRNLSIPAPAPAAVSCASATSPTSATAPPRCAPSPA